MKRKITFNDIEIMLDKLGYVWEDKQKFEDTMQQAGITDMYEFNGIVNLVPHYNTVNGDLYAKIHVTSEVFKIFKDKKNEPVNEMWKQIMNSKCAKKKDVQASI